MIQWIPLLPLIGFLINGLWYGLIQSKPGAVKAHATVPGIIATIAIFGAFVVSLLSFVQLNGMPADERVLEHLFFNWVTIGNFNLELALRLDPLSSIFTLLITGVGTLIHIYSIGYMSHDETPGKFFTYLNLFCFSMLMLILGASLPVLFFGWEGVGVCSYLLIGYWYSDTEKASAGKKAFIVNRIGDFGFILGMFLIFTTFGTLDFVGIKQAIETTGATAIPALTITAIALLLFVGCTGKSAQLPLYVWLPDAMAGPTPVSALIHAATMVTSGVYMISRLNFLFSLSHTAMMIIAVVGGLTAFFAATIAFAQNDIKKVLAYSTVSQLGYMFLACGVGAFSAGVFHVLTHGFFKALLFLGAGSVIHGMHEEQDIQKMGGLKSKMPQTFAVFTVAWLAICGMPPFSGFFSKDEILWLTFSSPHGSILLWILATLTAVMTAFYMTRLYVLTFFGELRSKPHGHVHESPMVMIAPLAVLALLSAFGGFMGIPHMSWLAHWLGPVIPEGHPLREGVSPSLEWVLMGLSVAGAGLGMFAAFKIFSNLKLAESYRIKFSKLHKTLTDKWYVDELYEAGFVKPIHNLSVALWKEIDIGVVDRVVVGLGKLSYWSGQTLRLVQTGSIQTYAYILVFGVILTVGYFIYGLV